MNDSGVSRREALSVITGATVSAWAVADPRALGAVAEFVQQAAAQSAYQVLTAAQARELDAVTSTIIPTDGTPGAREARVVRFIDRSLATWAKDQKPQVVSAIKLLGEYVAAQRPGTSTFAAVPAADRTKLLETFEQVHGGEFNGAFLFPTMAGMFANPSYGGNANKVGWSLMGFKDQFSWAPPFGYYDRV